MPVYAVQSGTVVYAGAAQGYGGPDPAGWLVVDSTDEEGGGCLEYGHIRRLPSVSVGSRVVAGQQIAVINPDQATNGGVAPHLHLSDMPGSYDPASKQNPLIRLAGALEPGRDAVLVNKPDFNEYAVWCNNNEPRNGVKVDLFLLHTEEGGPVKNGADRLARWLRTSQVSYHYTISQDPDDNGVTVCDVVDTDLASWSCLSANKRSINLVFAGSKASWTREQWMQQSKAIDVAAFLAVQDAKKYNFAPNVLAPPYSSDPPGVSDHKYVTEWLKDGTHSDVGGQFPWSYFAERVKFWQTGVDPAVVKPAPASPGVFVFPSQADMVRDIWIQLMGPRGKGWPQLGDKTLVDAVADLRKRMS